MVTICNHLCKNVLCMFSESLTGVAIKDFPGECAPDPLTYFSTRLKAGFNPKMCDYFASFPETDTSWRKKESQLINNRHHFRQSGISKIVIFIS